MNKIINLIRNIKTKEFLNKTKELYESFNEGKTNKKVGFDEYLSAIKGKFVDLYIAATDEDDMNYIINAAQKNDISAVGAEDIFKKIAATKSKTGEIVEEDYLENAINEISEYQYDAMYNDLSKYTGFISSIIKNYHSYYDIRKIKSGDYKEPANYRLSQSEIEKAELVKMIGPINRIMHNLYDVEGVLWSYCEYEDIPEDSILQRFAFHTDETNPLFKIVFEDGTIVEYLYGDYRVLPYRYHDIVNLTKLHITKELHDNNIFDVESIPKETFINLTRVCANKSRSILNTLETVYTKRRIDTSKREIEGIKKLVKEYDL